MTEPSAESNDPKDTLEFTGERFTPECVREIWYEHMHRYALATHLCANKRVLDAACGEGYGSALLAHCALQVCGVDIDETTIKHASNRYSDLENLNFDCANVTSLPFDDGAFDCIVSFETLEHLHEHSQMLQEFERVLADDGFILISSPDKAVYSEEQGNDNPFHVRELYQDEFEGLLKAHFPHYRLLGQRLQFQSTIWSLQGGDSAQVQQLNGPELIEGRDAISRPVYFIALAARKERSLPFLSADWWLFSDQQQSVYQHYQGEIRKNMAAGGIIAERDREIAQLKQQLKRLERLSPWYRRLLGKG